MEDEEKKSVEDRTMYGGLLKEDEGEDEDHNHSSSPSTSDEKSSDEQDQETVQETVLGATTEVRLSRAPGEEDDGPPLPPRGTEEMLHDDPTSSSSTTTSTTSAPFDMMAAAAAASGGDSDFSDVFANCHGQRLDTVEEVSEPASSDYGWQFDSLGSKDDQHQRLTTTEAEATAKKTSSDQLFLSSSIDGFDDEDFAPTGSLGAEAAVSIPPRSPSKASVVSNKDEEVRSVSEMEVTISVRRSGGEDDQGPRGGVGLPEFFFDDLASLQLPKEWVGAGGDAVKAAVGGDRVAAYLVSRTVEVSHNTSRTASASTRSSYHSAVSDFDERDSVDDTSSSTAKLTTYIKTSSVDDCLNQDLGYADSTLNVAERGDGESFQEEETLVAEQRQSASSPIKSQNSLDFTVDDVDEDDGDDDCDKSYGSAKKLILDILKSSSDSSAGSDNNSLENPCILGLESAELQTSSNPPVVASCNSPTPDAENKFPEKHEFEGDEKDRVLEAFGYKGPWGQEGVVDEFGILQYNESGNLLNGSPDLGRAFPPEINVREGSSSSGWAPTAVPGGSVSSGASPESLSEKIQSPRRRPGHVFGSEAPRLAPMLRSTVSPDWPKVQDYEFGQEFSDFDLRNDDPVSSLLLKVKKLETDKAAAVREMSEKLAGAYRVQTKQADLVDRLKYKLKDYKQQSSHMEKRFQEVNVLATQSQVRLDETCQALKLFEDRLKAAEERRFVEVRRLQVQVEEHQEKNKTLAGINEKLRHLYEVASNRGDLLSVDVDTLSAKWRRVNEELAKNPTNIALQSGSGVVVGLEELTQLAKEVCAIKGHFADMAASSRRTLSDLKDELGSMKTQVVGSCKRAQLYSDYLTDDKGNLVRVGSQKELWRRLQSMQSDKRRLEEKSAELEAEDRRSRSKLAELLATLTGLEEKNKELVQEVDRFKAEKLAFKGEKAKAKELEMTNSRLQMSLNEMVSSLMADADSDAEEGHSNANRGPSFTSTPMRSVSFANRSRSLATDDVDNSGLSSVITGVGSNARGRRTRSASPAGGPTQFSASLVHTALNKRHLQVQSLKTKLALSTDRIDQLSKNVLSKKIQIASSGDKLEKERRECDSLKIRLDEEMREKMTFKEKVDKLMVEKQALERAKASLEKELDEVCREKLEASGTAEKHENDARTAAIDRKRLEKVNERLTKDNKEKQMLISQLEKAGSKLREELLDTRELLEKTRVESAPLGEVPASHRHQNRRSLSSTAMFGVDVTDSAPKDDHRSEEVRKLKMSEKTLKEMVKTLDTARIEGEAKTKQLEERLLSIENVELANLNAELKNAKNELVRLEKSENRLEAEKTNLMQLLRDQEALHSKLEEENMTTRVKFEEADASVTTIKLENVALASELKNAKSEAQRFKEQLQHFFDENLFINSQRTELSAKAERLADELAEAKKRSKEFIQHDKEEQIRVLDGLRLELERLDNEKKRIEQEKIQVSETLDKMKVKLRGLKDELEDEKVRHKQLELRSENELNERKAKYESVIIQLKKELEEQDDIRSAEIEEIRRTLDKLHKAELLRLGAEHEERMEELRSEVASVNREMELQRQSLSEELAIAEDMKQQTLTAVEQERSAMGERCKELTDELEETRRELEVLQAELSSKIEISRAANTDLQMEVSRLKGRLEEVTSSSEENRAILNETIELETKLRNEQESLVESLKAKMAISEERVISLIEELEEAKAKAVEAEEEGRTKLHRELEENERRLAEAVQRTTRLERIRDEMEARQVAVAKEMRERLELLETETNRLREECLEVKDNNHELLEENQRLKADTAKLVKDSSRIKAQLQAQQQQQVVDEAAVVVSDEEQQQQRKVRSSPFWSGVKDRSRSSDSPDEISTSSGLLNLKMAELETSKARLESELTKTRDLLEANEGATRSKLGAINQALEESRSRERRSEVHRHQLEMAVNDANQQLYERSLKLNQYESMVVQQKETVEKLRESISKRSSSLEEIAEVLERLHQESAALFEGGSSGTRLFWAGRASDDEIVSGVKRFLRELGSRISATVKERDETFVHLASLKQKNAEMLERSSDVDLVLSRAKQKVSGLEEQLRKLEDKISGNDVLMANQDETIQQKDREIKRLNRKLGDAARQLEDLENRSSSSDDALIKLRGARVDLEKEMSNVQASLRESENRNSRLEILKKTLEGDIRRLQLNIGERDSENKDLRSKCAQMGSNLTSLEGKCANLSGVVDDLNRQLERLASRTATASSEIKAKDHSKLGNDSISAADSAADLRRLERSLSSIRADKVVLAQKLESWKAKAEEYREARDRAEEKAVQLADALQKAESRANVAQSELDSNRAALEASSEDNCLREDLSKMRAEVEKTTLRLKEATRKVALLELDKAQLEARLERQSKKTGSSLNFAAGPAADQVDHARPQIPLMASNSSESPFSSHCCHYQSKVKMAEREVERQKRTVRALRDQLGDLDNLYLAELKEVKEKKEREVLRFREAMDKAKASFSSKESIYLERIRGLEEQIEVLREQLSKELRHRRHLITSQAGIAKDTSLLRSNLSQSFDLLGTSNFVSNRDLGDVLDRETDRLHRVAEEHAVLMSRDAATGSSAANHQNFPEGHVSARPY